VGVHACNLADLYTCPGLSICGSVGLILKNSEYLARLKGPIDEKITFPLAAAARLSYMMFWKQCFCAGNLAFLLETARKLMRFWWTGRNRVEAGHS